MAKKKKITVEDTAEPQKGMIEKMGISDPDDLCSQINSDFADAEQVKYMWVPERNTDVKDYFGVIKPSEWPFKGASQIKSQFQRIVVDTLTGNLLKSLFMPEHPIKVEATNSESLDAARYVEDLHNFQAKEEYNLRAVLDKAVPTSLVESFTVLHPVYEYLVNDLVLEVKRWVPKNVDTSTLKYDLDTDSVSTADGQLVQSIDLSKGYENVDVKLSDLQEVIFEVERENCIKDGVSVKVINGYRFYMPISTPGETPWEKVQLAPFVFHQLFYTVREFENYKETGFFENVDPNLDDYYDPQKELISYTKYIQAGFVRDVTQTQTPFINVLKWCGKWKINGKWRELIVWKDKNSNTILRAEQNIFGVRMYIPLVPFPIDDTPYGESLCKIIRPLVREINLLMRIITNIALMKSAPPKFYDPASGFNPSAVGQFGPNSWIPAREPSRNVLIPPSPEDPQVAFQMLQFIINIVERITGVNEVIQGQVSTRANTTATEIQNATLRSGVRFDTIYERLKMQLSPLFSCIHMLNLRHMPLKKEIRLMGAEAQQFTGGLVQIHRGKIEGKFNFILSGNSIISQQSELQNAMALYNTLGQHPYLSYKPESIYYVLYNIVKNLNPVCMDKILPTPDEVKKLEREQAKVNGQQEQMAAQQQKESVLAQGQQQAMAQQMEVANQKQQMTLDLQKQHSDLTMKQAAFEQDSRHKEDLHKQTLKQKQAEHEAKLAQMKETAHAKEKESHKKS